MGFDNFDALLSAWVYGNYARPMKEVERYRVYNVDENTSVLVANTLGVSKDDLEVKMTGDVLTIAGKTKNDDIKDESSVDYSFRLSKERKVASITWKNADGFTYVYFHFDKPREISVKYAD